MKNEVWKNIENYEGLYQISNLGRIKSLSALRYSYNCKAKKKILIKRKEKVIKGYIDKDGYNRICLYKNETRHYPFVHRLVAQAFIPNPDNLPQVNHKDENKLNNSIENLEWCDLSYNVSYGTRNQRISKSLDKYKKPVIQYSLDMKFVKYYESVTKAAKEIKTSTSHISKCCINKKGTAKGYIWRYADTRV